MVNRDRVEILIYDVSGRLVCTLADTVYDPGSYAVKWDGINDKGRSVASGIYLCRMEAGSIKRTRKMVIVR